MEIFSKIIKHGFFLFFIVAAIRMKAQTDARYWQADYALGSIIEHKANMGNINTHRPELFMLGWHKNSSMDKAWKARYNFPDQGVMLNYQDFHNEHLGKTVGLYYATTYYLRDRNAVNQLIFQAGFGFAYNDQPFDHIENIPNQMMSTHLLYSQHFKLDYRRKQLFKNVGLQAGISFSHFSNASIQKPNLGINSIFLNLGLHYLHTGNSLKYEKPSEESFKKEPLHFYINPNLGFHEALFGLGTKPVYQISGYVAKRIGYKSSLQIGLDFFNSMSNKDLVRYNQATDDQINDIVDHHQLAVFIGHELYFNRLNLETQVGAYVYQKFAPPFPVYQKISFKYYLIPYKTAVSINLKTHLFEAEFSSIGIHQRIF